MRQRIFTKRTSSLMLTLSATVDSQYLVGCFSVAGHSIKSHSGARGCVRV
jgi:hypothetical protein